jgi:acyl-CoA synthetase (AMP-forming)/AMP-acid ligase II
MAFNIADLFEYTVDAVPERVALVFGDTRLTFEELDASSNRLAHSMAELGVGPGDKVGIYGPNSIEWVEGLLACYKLRAIPINVNFRYVEDELAYLFSNADMSALIFNREYAPRVAAVIDGVPTMKTLIAIEDGSDAALDGLANAATGVTVHEYARLIENGSPDRDWGERSPDDLYILYTGGTTGLPKGVMWRQEDVLHALGGCIDAVTGERVTSDHGLAERAAASGGQLVFLMIPPLMHGAGQWGVLTQMYLGNRLVLLPKFDPQHIWELIGEEGVNAVILTGDAMARPMIEEYEEHTDRYDASSLISVSSTAAVFSATVKDRYLDRFPNMIITDSVGSTEGGFNGLTMVAKGQTQISGGGPTVNSGADVVILDEQLELIVAPDDRVGMIGRGGNIPIGYYNDAEKTAATFIIAADGNRYAVPGDYAQWADEGRMVLLGRGSVSINSGGEKIYPEEVEQALKDHPAVYDCLVVGVPDERWGQRVAAVIQPREGHSVELEALAAHGRQFLASYKLPKEIHLVAEIVRSPSGKPDYPWAKRVATGGE